MIDIVISHSPIQRRWLETSTAEATLALLATDTWKLVSAMLYSLHLGVNSHIGFSTPCAAGIVGYTYGANSNCH